MKKCIVAFAMPARQWLWQVSLDDGATVADALAQARAQLCDVHSPEDPSPMDKVPWDAEVGIFGELCDRSAVPRDGDRIELYRPLTSDPKESRRERARGRKVAPDQGLSRPPPGLPKEPQRR
jgi:putative ubiquitin-RnfH superfamily antitoxin RatB of RatAB toxin-antitoxin module